MDLLYVLGTMIALFIAGYLYILSKQLDMIIVLLEKIERSD